MNFYAAFPEILFFSFLSRLFFFFTFLHVIFGDLLLIAFVSFSFAFFRVSIIFGDLFLVTVLFLNLIERLPLSLAL